MDSLMNMGSFSDMIRGMFTGTSDGVGPMQPQQQGQFASLMGGSGGGVTDPNSPVSNGILGGGGQTSKYAAPTEAMDRELGMSALSKYKDMSDYATTGKMFGQAGGAQSLSNNAMNRPQRGSQWLDPVLMGLMSRGR